MADTNANTNADTGANDDQHVNIEQGQETTQSNEDATEEDQALPQVDEEIVSATTATAAADETESSANTVDATPAPAPVATEPATNDSPETVSIDEAESSTDADTVVAVAVAASEPATSSDAVDAANAEAESKQDSVTAPEPAIAELSTSDAEPTTSEISVNFDATSADAVAPERDAPAPEPEAPAPAELMLGASSEPEASAKVDATIIVKTDSTSDVDAATELSTSGPATPTPVAPEPAAPESGPPSYDAAMSASATAAASIDEVESSLNANATPTPAPTTLPVAEVVAPAAEASAAPATASSASSSSSPAPVSRPVTPSEPEAQALSHEVMSQLVGMPGNKTCIDCGDARPMWASLSFGGLMCLTCCGAHRAMGVHLSFMRSLNLDNWTEKQVMYMRVGGNDTLRAFFAQKGVQDSGQERYHTPAAALYRMRIKALADNTTVMPSEEASMLAAHADSIAAAGGSGSSNSNEMMSAPEWVPDANARDCHVCNVRFSLMRRRHHCRFCGNVCCGLCAPSLNTKPIPKFGMSTPVRHCKQCYRSPLVNWAEMEALAAKTDIFPFKFPLSFPKTNST